MFKMWKTRLTASVAAFSMIGGLMLSGCHDKDCDDCDGHRHGGKHVSYVDSCDTHPVRTTEVRTETREAPRADAQIQGDDRYLSSEVRYDENDMPIENTEAPKADRSSEFENQISSREYLEKEQRLMAIDEEKAQFPDRAASLDAEAARLRLELNDRGSDGQLPASDRSSQQFDVEHKIETPKINEQSDSTTKPAIQNEQSIESKKTETSFESSKPAEQPIDVSAPSVMDTARDAANTVQRETDETLRSIDMNKPSEVKPEQKSEVKVEDSNINTDLNRGEEPADVQYDNNSTGTIPPSTIENKVETPAASTTVPSTGTADRSPSNENLPEPINTSIETKSETFVPSTGTSDRSPNPSDNAGSGSANPPASAGDASPGSITDPKNPSSDNPEEEAK